ncbi:MAG: YfiH family protein [Alphaproteobacteria bacterium]|jgi:YfiH family protein
MITHDILNEQPNLKHGFFTRKNGFSTGNYASLNMRIGSNDNPIHIAKNYAYVKETLQLDSLLTLKQTHSNKVITVTDPWDISNRPEGDGFVTSLKNIGLGILTADCGPLLLADTVNQIVGAAHLGRKGALTGLLENTVQAMEAIGADRSSIQAVLGATISHNNYEVGHDVYQEIATLMPNKLHHLCSALQPEKYKLDMLGLICNLCEDANISFHALDYCTYDNPDLFFSYRYNTHQNQSNYGCFISAISLI